MRSSRARLIKTLDWFVNQFGQLSKYLPNKQREPPIWWLGACGRASGFGLCDRGCGVNKPAEAVAGSGRQRASFWSGGAPESAHARSRCIWPTAHALPTEARVGCTQCLSTPLRSGVDVGVGGRWRCAAPGHRRPGAATPTGTTFLHGARQRAAPDAAPCVSAGSKVTVQPSG